MNPLPTGSKDEQRESGPLPSGDHSTDFDHYSAHMDQKSVYQGPLTHLLVSSDDVYADLQFLCSWQEMAKKKKNSVMKKYLYIPFFQFMCYHFFQTVTKMLDTNT